MGYIEEVNEALAAFPPFRQRVGEYRFTENALDTLQINIGLKCNLACKHCHVESSPARTEESALPSSATAVSRRSTSRAELPR